MRDHERYTAWAAAMHGCSRLRVAGSLFVIAGLSAGCRGGERGPAEATALQRPQSSVAGQVISTVNGAPIKVAEIDSLTNGSGLSATTALRRLQAEELLAQEAQRRGIGARWEVFDVERRAVVQALLASEVAAVRVEPSRVEAEYEKQRARFSRPEKRSAVHVLARLEKNANAADDAAAKEVAERMAPELERAQDLDQFIRAYRGAMVAGVHLVVERIPLVSHEGRLARPFLDAMFSVDAPSMVPEPVRTDFGWHVIRVTEIQPAYDPPKEEALATLQKELLLEQQKKHIEEFVTQLHKAYPVQLPKNVDQLLASLPF